MTLSNLYFTSEVTEGDLLLMLIITLSLLSWHFCPLPFYLYLHDEIRLGRTLSSATSKIPQSNVLSKNVSWPIRCHLSLLPSALVIELNAGFAGPLENGECWPACSLASEEDLSFISITNYSCHSLLIAFTWSTLNPPKKLLVKLCKQSLAWI